MQTPDSQSTSCFGGLRVLRRLPATNLGSPSKKAGGSTATEDFLTESRVVDSSSETPSDASLVEEVNVQSLYRPSAASQLSLRTPDFGACSSAGDLHSGVSPKLSNSSGATLQLQTPEFGTQEFNWQSHKDSEAGSAVGSLLIPNDKRLHLPIVRALSPAPHLQLPCHQPVLPTILSARRAEAEHAALQSPLAKLLAEKSGNADRSHSKEELAMTSQTSCSGSYASTGCSSSLAIHDRFDFGIGLARCCMCHARPILNRGCQTCWVRMCRNCFPEHRCTVVADMDDFFVVHEVITPPSTPRS